MPGQQGMVERGTWRGVQCSALGCDRAAKLRGFCCRDYERWTRNGNPDVDMQAEIKARWKPTNEGYLARRRPDGTTELQHRSAMEDLIGRKLTGRENVHHRNGIRSDNRIENLELWVRPQPAGQRVEDLVRWVVDEYPELAELLLNERKEAEYAEAQQ